MSRDDDAKRARGAVADAGARDAKRARGAAADESERATTTTTTDALAGASGGTAMVQGVPEQWDDGAFAAWLTTLGCRRASSKKRRRWTYGFVTFGEVGDRIEATTAMERVEFRGRRVRVKQAKAKGKAGGGVDGWVDGRGGARRTRERERETGHTRRHHAVVEGELRRTVG